MTQTLPASLPSRVLALASIFAAQTQHGGFVSLKTARPLGTKKGVTPVLKVSEYTCRLGVCYDNQKSVQEKRESGELPAENQGLLGRTWVIPNFLMQSEKSGKFLIRVTPVRTDTAVRSVKFFRNGAEISKDEAMIGALAKESYERETTDAFDIQAESVVEVNGNPV